MKKFILLFVNFLVLASVVNSQEKRADFYDNWLASNFQVFQSVDTELAYAIATIIEERLISRLSDSNSLNYTFDSLSKYITIRMSQDSLVRTFSWDRRGGGSYHDMAAYVQYKTESGKVKCKTLDAREEEPMDVIIYNVYTIPIKNKPHYLMMGWGTYGGGRLHYLARVYTVNGDSLLQVDSMFEGQNQLFVEANRSGKIELEYDTITKILSHNSYEFVEDHGFYKRESTPTIWVLKNDKFIKQE